MLPPHQRSTALARRGSTASRVEATGTAAGAGAAAKMDSGAWTGSVSEPLVLVSVAIGDLVQLEGDGASHHGVVAAGCRDDGKNGGRERSAKNCREAAFGREVPAKRCQDDALQGTEGIPWASRRSLGITGR